MNQLIHNQQINVRRNTVGQNGRIRYKSVMRHSLQTVPHQRGHRIHQPRRAYRTTRNYSIPKLETEEKSGVNFLDLIFMTNLITMLFVLNIFFSHSFGPMGLLFTTDILTIPQGLYISSPPPAETPITGGSAAANGAISKAPEINQNQFEALSLSAYTLKPGDTLSQIAIDHGLNMDTLISFNKIRDVRRLQIGQEFKIPNRDGLLHTVSTGDSLSGLAEEYGSSFNAILDANSLFSEEITPEQALFIPGARMDSTALKLVLGELFIFPTNGRFTSGFGYRADPFTGQRRFHNGIDLANNPGTSVRASMAGTVVHIESQIGNYGKFIIIQHAGGFQTLYAHLNTIGVNRGEYIYQGETIGRMGNTGRSTGPHLHFSIIRNGVFENPLNYLN